MKSFVVMQGHTYHEEKENGFIWAAKQDSSGMPSHSWQRMMEVEKGDLIFHYVKGEILAISVATKGCEIAHRPSNPQHHALWNDPGYFVELEVHELDVPIQIRAKFEEILPLLPIKYSPFQMNGHGNQGYLYPCNEELAVKLLEMIADSNITEIENEQLALAISPVVQTERNPLIPLLAEAESELKAKIRLGEGILRAQMMPLWADQCTICGIDLPIVLRATRSKPWKDCTRDERIDPYNGMLLCANHEILYKTGYIAFDGQGKIHIAEEILEEDYKKFGIHRQMKIARMEQNKSYFKWHKRHIFRKG